MRLQARKDAGVRSPLYMCTYVAWWMDWTREEVPAIQFGHVPNAAKTMGAMGRHGVDPYRVFIPEAD
jgi:hypothetical protein